MHPEEIHHEMELNVWIEQEQGEKHKQDAQAGGLGPMPSNIITPIFLF